MKGSLAVRCASDPAIRGQPRFQAAGGSGLQVCACWGRGFRLGRHRDLEVEAIAIAPTEVERHTMLEQVAQLAHVKLLHLRLGEGGLDFHRVAIAQ